MIAGPGRFGSRLGYRVGFSYLFRVVGHSCVVPVLEWRPQRWCDDGENQFSVKTLKATVIYRDLRAWLNLELVVNNEQTRGKLSEESHRISRRKFKRFHVSWCHTKTTLSICRIIKIISGIRFTVGAFLLASGLFGTHFFQRVFLFFSAVVYPGADGLQGHFLSSFTHLSLTIFLF